MGQLRKDKEMKVVSVNYKVDGTYEEWGRVGELVEHIKETDRRIERMSEELSAKTKNLANDPFSHVEPTDNDIEAVRNQVTEINVQMCEGNSKANIFPRKGPRRPKEG
jgi:hypothetical protein